MIIGTENNKPLKYNKENLKKHFIALGASGSGKTVFCKSVIEEANVPTILIDSQGDLASMKGAKIYTPASTRGIHLSLNPFKYCNDEETIENVSSTITEFAGYKQGSTKFNNVKYLIYEVLSNNKIKKFNDLIEKINDSEESDFYVKSEVKNLIRKLKSFTIGKNALLFNSGTPLDINNLLKNKISVIYINTLKDEATKKCFIAMLSTQLYQWMLHNPSKKLQALFFIDEIEQFIPAGSIKPASKDILKQIFKQARKYGVGCMAATQNPGDIDYKAFAQFGTWGVGRLTTKQDMAKVKDVIGNLDLSKLKIGEFYVYCPDEYNTIKKIKTLKLKSNHKTLSENEIGPSTNKINTIQKNLIKIFPLNFEIEQLIKKKQKKKFFYFGEDENYKSHELILTPIFKIQARTKSLFGFKNHYLYVNVKKNTLISNKGVFELESKEISNNISDYSMKINIHEKEMKANNTPTYDPSKISNYIEKKFKCEVIHCELIYLPVYEIEFKGQHGIRKVRVSAYTGNEI